MKTNIVNIQKLIDANNEFRARDVSRGETRIETDLLTKQLERRLHQEADPLLLLPVDQSVWRG